MKAPIRSRHSQSLGWTQGGIEALRQALRILSRMLAVPRPPESLALVPIRAVQPPSQRQLSRPRSQRPWHD